MGKLLARVQAAGVRLEAISTDKLRAVGALSDELRTLIRDHKAEILAELAAANDYTPPEPEPADNGLRACIDCGNLTASGQCLAAWRGEAIGAGLAIRRQYHPAMTERPQRCAGYRPGPDDQDQREGQERWPMLVTSKAP